ncbi:co-chaperone YbbN [Phenylobacterium sp.]|uniref:thioredoxin family protein n=1 Tax=Phenylobacterium sp. TaxID=1871053 RepID=UPI002730C161|nr:co-chaperone YbbN [Phenylobacterium sp.]MDP1599893.1 co-chaperone YbbN [Phenylobacterium sp.]MDP3590938.1 co-chaperone YbbN [Phenylobacterium sp.]
MSLIGETQSTAAAGPADLIKDGTDASFLADVIETSKDTPVIVDFWAPWCGPCRQLGPSIEKAVLAAKGKVKLVKIDIDQNPQFAGQLRVQSIPAVFAFVGGRPVDGFMGALPDSQVKQFVDRMAGQAPANATDELLAQAKESLDLGDIGGAAQAYAEVLQGEPDNVKALGGLARCYLNGGDAERAREVADMAPPGAKDADLDSVRAALALADEAPEETGEFEQRLAKDDNDHEARFEIAKALAARGAWDEAADHLLKIIERDRTWNDEAARKQLITIFEAAGAGSDVTRAGRRRLSSILFS